MDLLSQIPPAELRKASAQFVRECQLMSTLRHPHIVQFLGVYFFPDSRLPALVMERLHTSLHDLLDLETASSRRAKIVLSAEPKVFHTTQRSQRPSLPPRAIAARHPPRLVCQKHSPELGDGGQDRMRAAATMTKAPGASVYMPPEAVEDKPGQDDEDEGKTSKYDASIDIFSFGVVSIFTLSQTFPCKLLAPTYRNEQRKIIGRSELERREHYTRMIYSQLREKHPLLQMIERCLDFYEDRPSIYEVLHLLEQARDEDRDEQVEMNKLELLQVLQTQPRHQVREVCY